MPSTICRAASAAALAAWLCAWTPALAAMPETAQANAAVAAAEGLDPRTVEAIVSRGRARGLEPAVLALVLGHVEEAAARGLPVEGVADKVLEGIAKGIPPQQIVPVVEGMVQRLGAADAALAQLPASPAARRQLVEEGAEALRRGADADALAALAVELEAADLSAGQLGVALRALGDLGERRAAPAMAGVAIGRMVKRGYAAGAVSELPHLVRDALAEGAAPAELLEEIAARAASGRPMDRLVDPFAERPGTVLRDPAAERNSKHLPAAPPGKAKGLGKHPLGGPPGRSGLDRPGLQHAPGPIKRTENGRGQPGGKPSQPGKGQGGGKNR